MAEAIILDMAVFKYEDGSWAWSASVDAVTVMMHSGFQSKEQATVAARRQQFSPGVRIVWRGKEHERIFLLADKKPTVPDVGRC